MRRLLSNGCILATFLVSCFLPSNRGWAATFSSVGLYSSFNSLPAWAYQMESANPGLVNVVQYGATLQGNPLLAVEITSHVTVNDTSKSDFLFTGGIHAREVVTSDAMLTLAQNLVSGYTSGNQTYINMLSKRDVWIIPDQNPDGRLYVESGNSSQRKNRHAYSGQTVSTYGVDLNRNYPHLWSQASSVVTAEDYRGPSALSEAESSSLWGFLHDTTRFSHLLCSVDFHSGAQNILINIKGG